MNADLETNKACNKQTYNTIKDMDANKKRRTNNTEVDLMIVITEQ